MKTLYKILPWALLIIAVAIIYQLWSSNDSEVKATKAKIETLEKSIDTISVKQKALEDKAIDSAKSFSDKGKNTIKIIYYEKKPIVLPAADSVNRYIAAYKFTQRK